MSKASSSSKAEISRGWQTSGTFETNLMGHFYNCPGDAHDEKPSGCCFILQKLARKEGKVVVSREPQNAFDSNALQLHSNGVTQNLEQYASLSDVLDFALEKSRGAEPSLEPLPASYSLVYLWTDLRSSFSFVVAHYEKSSAHTGLDIADHTLDVMAALHEVEFETDLILADGSAPNFSALRCLCHSVGDPFWWESPFFFNDLTGRKTFVCVDPVHLLKSARTSLNHSRRDKTHPEATRHMVLNGQSAVWEDIQRCFDYDVLQAKQAGGLRLTRLTPTHLNVDAFLKMRVPLASEVLSSQVAAVLEIVVGSNTSGTSEYVHEMVQFFERSLFCPDHLHAAGCKGADPTPCADVCRCLTHHIDWICGHVLHLKRTPLPTTNVERQERLKEFLHRTTSQQQLVTAHAFLGLISQFHAQFPESYLVLKRITQDRLEGLFGRLRHLSGGNEKLTEVQLNAGIARLTALEMQHFATSTAASSSSSSNVSSSSLPAGIEISKSHPAPYRPVWQLTPG